MFRITAETCRRFTLAEVLIMAAINVAPAPIATDRGESTICHTPGHGDSRGSRRLSWQK